MRSSKSRQRSKPNRPRTLGNIINRVFDSSGPEGKVRGTPQQIIEKYQFLARDAQLSNDRVAAENFMQHAEHYTRMLAEAAREMAAEQEQRPPFVTQNAPQNVQQNGQNGGNASGGSGTQSRDYRSGQGQGDRNQGDRGQQDRNQGDRNQQDRNQGDRNQQDRNQGDRNQNDRNQADRNQNDRNQNDRNQNDRDQRSDDRNEYRDPGQDDQPGLRLADDAGYGESGLVETPEAARPQRAPREEPRRDEPRRDDRFRKPRPDDRPAAMAGQPAPKPAVAAEEPGLPGFLTAPLMSESLTEPQAEPPKPTRAPRARKPAAPKIDAKDEAAE